MAAASAALQTGCVTTKSEPSATADEPHVAAPPAGEADPAPLPSIIVDPAALSTTEAASVAAAPGGESASTDTALDADAAVRADDPPATEASPAPAPDRDDAADGQVEASAHGEGAGAVELSVLEAERFAADYRASWEPGEPLDAPMPVQAQPLAAASSAIAVGGAEAGVEPLVLPGTARSRGLALTAIAVLAFAALLALALSSTREPPAPTPSADAAAPPSALQAPEPEPPTPLTPVEASSPPQPTQIALVEPAQAAAAVVAGAPAPQMEVAAALPEGAQPQQPQPQQPQPQQQPQKPVDTVRIRIATTPEAAVLAIDGVTVPNPYDELVPKSEKHRITASAPGHEPVDQLVGFERKRDLVLRLEPVRAPRPKPAQIERPARAPAVKTARKPAPATEAPRKGAAFVSESPY